MTTPNHGMSPASGFQVAPIRRVSATDSFDLATDTERDGAQDVWQLRMGRLQQWICELLIKNQQLRIALAETKANELRG